MSNQQTAVERSIETAVRERLRDTGEYQRGDAAQRERIEREVRKSILIRRAEDDA
jgi:hypothetical protein